jgi:hypothetical protein
MAVCRIGFLHGRTATCWKVAKVAVLDRRALVTGTPAAPDLRPRSQSDRKKFRMSCFCDAVKLLNLAITAFASDIQAVEELEDAAVQLEA